MEGAAPEHRSLGETGLRVSSLGMGCAKLGAFWQGRSPRAAREALDAARGAGINFFDTADCYARGLSERIIGRVFRHQREDVVICTKVGMLKTPLALASARRLEEGRSLGMAELKGMGRDAPAAQCFSPRYVEMAVERSLRRLKSDRIDLLLLHGPSVEVLRTGAFLPAVQTLRQSGRIRHFGVSCRTEQEARAALELTDVACLQLPHNIGRADVVPAVQAEALRRGVGLVAMAPFGDGHLLATAQDGGPPTTARLEACLQFALSSPGIASVMVGMSTPEHVAANVRAAVAPPLPPDELDSIRRVISQVPSPRC